MPLLYRAVLVLKKYLGCTRRYVFSVKVHFTLSYPSRRWDMKYLYLVFFINMNMALLIYIFPTDDTERHLEQLHRGVLEDPTLDNPYIVLSQHQMQNLGNYHS